MRTASHGAGAALAALLLASLPSPASAGEGPADPQARVEELQLRIQGVDDKLKESAAARKSADQARMEADRRLAEGLQERERLTAEIALLRESKEALESSVRRHEERGAALTEGLAAAEERVRRVQAELESEALRTAALGRQLEEQREAQARLEGEIARRDGEIARLGDELGRVQAERGALGQRLKELSALVPAPEGGSLTREQAEAQASGAAESLRAALAGLDGPRDIQGRFAVREAEQALHRRQFAVARVCGARSVYRVRPNDTLALIATRFYGDGSHWGEIRDANRHVLTDPDRLAPGLTLVIP